MLGTFFTLWRKSEILKDGFYFLLEKYTIRYTYRNLNMSTEEIDKP